MSKILFIDVDGTLVDYTNHLPETHRVYICTGRSRAEVYANIWDIGIDGMIGGNGSYVEDHDTVVMHQLITKEQCRHIVDWLHGRGLEFYLAAGCTPVKTLRRRRSRPFRSIPQERAGTRM